MDKLVLVRHAAPATDPCVAPSQWPLSEAGRASIPALAEALQPYLPAALYASREAKAAETASMTARVMGVKFTAWPGLHEHLRSTDDWLGNDEFESRIAEIYARPMDVVFGAESADAAYARFAAAIAALTAEAPPGNLIAFTHGMVMTLLVSRANAGIEPLPFWRALKLPAVVVLDRAALALERVIEKVGADGH